MPAQPAAAVLALLLAALLIAPPGGVALRDLPHATGDAALALAGDDAALRARFTPPAGDHVAPLLDWTWKLGGLQPGDALPQLPPAPQLPLTTALAEAYGIYALPALSAAQRLSLASQESALDPQLASATAGLLRALAAHQPIAQGLIAERLQQPLPSAAFDARAEFVGAEPLLASVHRIALASDALTDALRAAQARAPFPARGAFVFQDPLGLVRIGDAGHNEYDGNVANLPHIDPRANILTVDLGGDDTYHNYAGGGYPTGPCWRYAPSPFPQKERYDILLPDVNDPMDTSWICGTGVAASASIDLAGNDTYDVSVVQGDDQHVAAQAAGMFWGVGLLVDLAGNDQYSVRTDQRGIAYTAAQGSGGSIAYPGYGVLLDAGGDDHYLADEATSPMPEGNFSQLRSQGGDNGVLFDLGGDDAFETRQHGTGTAFETTQGSVAFLFDVGGQDRYLADQRTGDGSFQLAQADDGWLLDTEGDDAYVATQSCPTLCGWQDGQAGGEAPQSNAELVDLAGNDTYVMTTTGAPQHAQGGCFGSQCLLLDLGGDDVYFAHTPRGIQVVQGAATVESYAWPGTESLLYDASGNDTYVAEGNAGSLQYAQGAAELLSLHGILLDHRGDDTYAAVCGCPTQYVQGSGTGPALFLDGGGQDRYSSSHAANGATWMQGLGVGVDTELPG